MHDQELSTWRTARRYAVPRWMIEQATERRLAGDWRGACAAAHVDVDIDPADLAPEIEDDLRHLAPDLLRWHLPRGSQQLTTVVANLVVVLARRGEDLLYVLTPPVPDGAQRLRLGFGPLPPEAADLAREDWSGHRYLWDARHAGGLLTRWGGDRPPFFHADGAPLTDAELPAGDPGPDDPVARAEWLMLRRDRDGLEKALTDAGLDALPARANGAVNAGWLRFMTVDPAMFDRLVRGLREAGVDQTCLTYQSRRFLLDTRLPHLSTLRRSGGPSPADPSGSAPPEQAWRELPDLALLRAGRITPEDLHPLVRDALFPKRPAADRPVGPPDPEPPAPFRVRCRDREWHLVSLRDGRLDVPHPAEEQRRERAVVALGGTTTGCFAVQEAWANGRKRLPRALRAFRRELLLRFQHGDTPGVTRLLDAGLGPHFRDGLGRGPLHLLHLVDHEELLPRLLAAGLDVNATDHRGWTPLFTAVAENGSERYARALLEAGARTDMVDWQGRTLATMIHQWRRPDLRFLHERVRRDHPHPPRHRGEPD
ncbi:ankyrin repeat domain-containing protein [Actinomadura kijaniata]|uniref:ankyrin repeat domain-containing protein n=1 Tax=Actinomadura kijaniata TaxID=46161 RepID=UPI003F199DAE